MAREWRDKVEVDEDVRIFDGPFANFQAQLTSRPVNSTTDEGSR